MINAIITGGSSGIGKATATLLVKNGWNVFLIARDVEKLTHTKNELDKIKLSPEQLIETHSVDVSDGEQVRTVIDSICTRYFPDQLITCAGEVNPGYFEDLPLQDFKKFMEINYLGTVYMIRAVLPYMLERKQGHITMISSMAGLIGCFGYGSYAPTKAALKSLAEILRVEMKPKGINISICYPPDTDTPQFAKENLTKPLETKMINEIGGLYSADYVAECIVRGINKKKFVIVPGRSNYLIFLLMSPLIFPLLSYADWIVKKVAKIKLSQEKK